MNNIFRWLAITAITLVFAFNISCSQTSYDRLNNPNGQSVTDSYNSVNFNGIDYPKGWQAIPHNDSSDMESANFTGAIGDNTAHIDMTILLGITYDDFKNELKQNIADKLLHEDLTDKNNSVLFSVFGGRKDNEIVTVFVCRLNSKTKLISPQNSNTCKCQVKMHPL